VPPGDGAALAEAVRSIERDPQRGAEMGRNARSMLDRGFSRLLCLGSWENLFDTLAEPDFGRPLLKTFTGVADPDVPTRAEHCLDGAVRR
jgi:hypothetical protein